MARPMRPGPIKPGRALVSFFGEIEDEHDNIAHYERQLESNLFEFSARLEVDYINQNYGISLPENEFYETLGGLIVHLKEEIPTKGTKIVFGASQDEDA